MRSLLPKCSWPLTMLLMLPVFWCDVLAVDVKGTIGFNEVCHGMKELKSAQVILDGGRWKANVLRDGRFAIRDVDPGTYVLDVLARDHVFEQLRVDVVASSSAADTTDTASVSESTVLVRSLPPATPHNPSSPLTPLPALLPYPIVIRPRIAKVYIVAKPEFSVIAMFKGNPMMLMMAGTAILMFLMPKLLENMDPEDKKEFMSRQSTMMSVQNSVTDMDIGGGLSKLLGNNTDSNAHTSDNQTPPPNISSARSPAKKNKGKKK